MLELTGFVDFIASHGTALPHWSREQQPHVQSNILSRFREAIYFPASDVHPTASIVWQARCEIDNDVLHDSSKLILSKDGTFMAMAASGGYKRRDPKVVYWPALHESLEHKAIVPPLAHQVHDIVLDNDRQLFFITDYDRIKSYSFASETRNKATHTLNSGKHHGPLAVLPNSRIIKAGVGSALAWNLSRLETHYDDSTEFRKIGEGSYQGFKDSWREPGCGKELSTGSSPHVTITFTDPEFAPEVWEYHVPSGYMLCGEDSDHRQRFETVALDLEHGGTVVTRYIGHGDSINTFSCSGEDPNSFLTSCDDGYVRLFDLRDQFPVLTIDIERHSSMCKSAIYTHLDGIPGTSTP